MSDNGQPAKSGRPSYPLTSAQRTYVSTGDPGGSRESEVESAVENKVEQLGQRVDHLLSDVQLLAHNGFLDEDRWFDAWVDFIGFGDSGYRPNADRRAVPEFVETGIPGYEDVTDEDPTHTDIVDACTVGAGDWRSRPTSSPEQIGYQVGAMLQRLMFYPDGVNAEKMSFDIAWGLADGFLRGDMPAYAVSGDQRRELKEDFIKYQQNRLEGEVDIDKEWEERRTKSHEQSEAWTDARTEMKVAVEETLSEIGLPIHSEFRHRVDKEGFKSDEAGLEAGEVTDYLIDHLVDVPDDIDEKPAVSGKVGTMGQWALFQNQYGPVDEFDPEEVVTEEAVLGAVEEHDLLEKAQLAAFVDDDVETLADTGWKKIGAVDVVNEVAEQAGSARSADIARAIKGENHKGSVTKLCADLAGRDFERAILEGGRGNWSLTPYGKLVAEYVSNSYSRKTRPRITRREDSVVEQAIEQVGIEGWAGP